MSESIIRYIPVDNQFRMLVADLKRQVLEDKASGLMPFMVVGSAGTTDVGAIDPLDEIGLIAQEHNIWFHVDAAYGGFFLMVDELKPLFKGIERSDSFSIDPHKSLFLSFGLGAILMKDVKAQYRAHYYEANYLQDALNVNEEYSPADLSPELTRPFRGLRMWMSIQLHGLRPFRAALAEKRLLCLYFYERIQELGFKVGPPPDLTVCIFRFDLEIEASNIRTKLLMDFILHEGSTFVSSTTIDSVFWIRMAVLNFRCHKKEIDLFLKLVTEGSREIMGSSK